MSRSSTLPLVLWVAAAIAAHAIGGGGVETVATIQEQTLDLEEFTTAVRSAARRGLAPLEMTTIDEEEWEINLDEFEATPDKESEPPLEEADDTLPLELKKKQEKKKEQEKELPPDEKAEEKVQAAEAQPTPPADNRRVAIDQYVEDKNQEDNPDARFAAENAQRVEEETQAKITARDAETKEPATPGSSDSPVADEVGNSEETEVRESDESEGDPEELPSEPTSAQEEQQAQQLPQEIASGAPEAASTPAQEARDAQEEQIAAPELLENNNGKFALSRPMTPAEAAEAKRFHKSDAHDHSEHLPQNYQDLLGLGSSGKTASGVNLNLSQAAASTLIGAEQIAALRKKQGERRLSKHRGAWDNQGLEKWRPALENYVASVKVGNTTALNAARVPFASYLNHIHQKLHLIFAQRFLGYLSRFPADHPINNPAISTHLEVGLSRKDGRIVKMGVIKSSGVTAFDVGALDAVSRAGPYGVPPSAIVSADGNVYLHWEFHRRPEYACSTYFARPKIITDVKALPQPVKPPAAQSETQASSDARQSENKSPGKKSQDLAKEKKTKVKEKGALNTKPSQRTKKI